MQPTLFEYKYLDLDCCVQLIACPPYPLQVMVGALPGKDPTEQQIAEAESRGANLVDAAGRVATEYESSDDKHLRVFAYEQAPLKLATLPPEDFHWSILSLAYDIQCDHNHRGFKSRKVYFNQDGEPVFGLAFTHEGATVSGKSALRITEQVVWYRNDGSEYLGAKKDPKTLLTESQAWIDYMEACRATIHRNYKLWVPKALIAVGETEETEGDVALLESRMMASAWLSGPVGAAMDFYVRNGDPRPLFDALDADETSWLESVIPDHTIPGLASGKTIEQMIREGLR